MDYSRLCGHPTAGAACAALADLIVSAPLPPLRRAPGGTESNESPERLQERRKAATAITHLFNIIAKGAALSTSDAEEVLALVTRPDISESFWKQAVVLFDCPFEHDSRLFDPSSSFVPEEVDAGFAKGLVSAVPAADSVGVRAWLGAPAPSLWEQQSIAAYLRAAANAANAAPPSSRPRARLSAALFPLSAPISRRQHTLASRAWLSVALRARAPAARRGVPALGAGAAGDEALWAALHAALLADEEEDEGEVLWLGDSASPRLSAQRCLAFSACPRWSLLFALSAGGADTAATALAATALLGACSGKVGSAQKRVESDIDPVEVVRAGERHPLWRRVLEIAEQADCAEDKSAPDRASLNVDIAVGTAMGAPDTFAPSAYNLGLGPDSDDDDDDDSAGSDFDPDDPHGSDGRWSQWYLPCVGPPRPHPGQKTDASEPASASEPESASSSWYPTSLPPAPAPSRAGTTPPLLACAAALSPWRAVALTAALVSDPCAAHRALLLVSAGARRTAAAIDAAASAQGVLGGGSAVRTQEWVQWMFQARTLRMRAAAAAVVVPVRLASAVDAAAAAAAGRARSSGDSNSPWIAATPSTSCALRRELRCLSSAAGAIAEWMARVLHCTRAVHCPSGAGTESGWADAPLRLSPRAPLGEAGSDPSAPLPAPAPGKSGVSLVTPAPARVVSARALWLLRSVVHAVSTLAELASDNDDAAAAASRGVTVAGDPGFASGTDIAHTSATEADQWQCAWPFLFGAALSHPPAHTVTGAAPLQTEAQAQEQAEAQAQEQAEALAPLLHALDSGLFPTPLPVPARLVSTSSAAPAVQEASPAPEAVLALDYAVAVATRSPAASSAPPAPRAAAAAAAWMPTITLLQALATATAANELPQGAGDGADVIAAEAAGAEAPVVAKREFGRYRAPPHLRADCVGAIAAAAHLGGERAQTVLGAAGAVELCLQCTHADAEPLSRGDGAAAAAKVQSHDPFLREWAIMAVRALTAEHWANQRRVGVLALAGVAANKDLEAMGVRAWSESNPETGHESVRLAPVDPARAAAAAEARSRPAGTIGGAGWVPEDDPSGLFSEGPARSHGGATVTEISPDNDDGDGTPRTPRTAAEAIEALAAAAASGRGGEAVEQALEQLQQSGVARINKPF